MPAISKEQTLALMYGVLIKKDGSTNSTTFTGIPGETLFNPGIQGLTTTTNLSTSNAVVVIASTAGLVPGMSITKATGGGAFFTTSPIVVFSVDSNTNFKVGNFAEKAVPYLTATLTTSPATNIVTLTGDYTTRNLRPGMKVTRISGDGAFHATGPFIKAILNERQFSLVTTVGTDNVPGATAANHATPGDIVFYAGGIVRNHAIAGAITSFCAGGIDFTNDQIKGLGDPTPQVVSLANSSSTVGTNVVAITGGDISNNNSLSNEEKDYHLTGQGLRKKLK